MKTLVKLVKRVCIGSKFSKKLVNPVYEVSVLCYMCITVFTLRCA